MKTATNRLQDLARAPADTPVLLDVPEFGQANLMGSFMRGRAATTVSGEAAWSKVRGARLAIVPHYLPAMYAMKFVVCRALMQPRSSHFNSTWETIRRCTISVGPKVRTERR